MYEFDRFEHTTVVAALIHYALHVAHPEECIRCLEILVPEPKRPWAELIPEVREQRLELEKLAVFESEDAMIAAQRER